MTAAQAPVWTSFSNESRTTPRNESTARDPKRRPTLNINSFPHPHRLALRTKSSAVQSVSARRRSDSLFYLHQLLIRHFRKQIALILCQPTFIMHDQTHEQRRTYVGHIHNFLGFIERPVVSLNESDLFTQILLDGFCHAFVEVFGLRSCIEILIQILCLIQDRHLLRLIHPVFNKRSDFPRECRQRFVILGNVAQHDGRNREDDALRRVAQFRQAVMYQEAMDAPVAIFEWMHEDKTESRENGRTYRIQTILFDT